MQFSHNIEWLFYIGAGIIILFYIGVVLGRFKDEQFDFSEHKWIALTYILLMVATIVLWRYIFDMVLGPKVLEMIVSDIQVA